MLEIKTQYPYVDEFGVSHSNLIKHWVEDENGNLGKMLQVETGLVYDIAVDIYPCKYNYVIYYEENEYFTDKEVIVEEDEQ